MTNAYIVLDNGDLQPTEVASYEDLGIDQVIIIVDDRARKIHIWKGDSAPVRKKFISARSAQKMRMELGMTFNVVSEDAGIESRSFLALMGAGEAPVEGAVASEQTGPLYTGEASTPTVTATPKGAPTVTAAPKGAPTVTAAPKAAPTVTSAPKAAPTVSSTPKPAPAVTSAPKTTPVAKPTPSYVSKPAPAVIAAPKETPTSSAPGTPALAVSYDSVDTAFIEDKLKEIGEPEGMIREIVVAGNQVFSVLKVHQALFNIDMAKLEPMDGLPVGTFPAAEYYPRIYIDNNGRVLFIELFRDAPEDEKEEFVSEMKRSLTDLSKLGI